MDHKNYDILEQMMCKELDMLVKKYTTATTTEMDVNDLKKIDMLYHALKSKATYDAMNEANEYGMDYGQMSGRRGYSSRMSGHYPEPDYYAGSGGYPYPPRRW